MDGARPPSGGDRPDVIVDFEFEDGWLLLAVTNAGAGPAHGVSTSFEPSFSGLGGSRRIPDLGLFDGIGFLSPGKTIRTIVDDAQSYFAREEPTEIRTDVSFEDAEGRSFHNRGTHTLDTYRDLPHFTGVPSRTLQATSVGGPPSRFGRVLAPSGPEVDRPTPPRTATFELYEDRGGEFRWRLVHPNGNIIADSGEGYASKRTAEQGIESVRENAMAAEIEDHT